MNIEGTTLWQHAAGDPDHNHVELCLDWDVILIGPGDVPWPETNRDGVRKEVHAFCEQMQEGDIVILKRGQSRVYGVGVIGEYKWCDEFNDVDGWDLGHTRRVHWLWPGEHDPDHKSFHPNRPLTRSTTQRIYNDVVRQWLKELDAVDDVQERTYRDLPKPGSNVTGDDIAAYLFDKGIVSDSIRNLLDPNGEFLQIAKWYNGWEWGSSPSEHETVSHLVVPLLRILGWTPQRISLEWNKIDVALFSRLPRDNADLAIVLEAKRVRSPCLSWAVTQAKGYAEGLPRCLRLIVTEGLRYGVFTRKTTNEKFSRYAYLNLTRPRTEYLIYECKGAKEAILAMTPDWQPDWQ